MNITVLHQRDPDSGCVTTVFVNGAEVEADIIDVDPGRGWDPEDFAEHWASTREETRGDLREAVDLAFVEAADSPYVRASMTLCVACDKPIYEDQQAPVYPGRSKWSHAEADRDNDHAAQGAFTRDNATESIILMLAEVRWNLTGDPYEEAETDVRAMLADGWAYDPDRGWQPPADTKKD